MRSNFALLCTILITTAVSLLITHDAMACDAGTDATVRFAIKTVGHDAPTSNATVNYHIVPYGAPEVPDIDPCEEDPDDPACIDPCEEDPDDPACIDPCEEDPDDPACDEAPAPVSGTLSVSLTDEESFELPAGEADFEFALDGYETTVVHRAICGETTVRVTLMSDQKTTFTAYVGRWQGEVPAEGTLVTLRGRNERTGERFEAETNAEGHVEIGDIPAGLYALEASLLLDTSHEFLTLEALELLQDGHVSIRLRSSEDRPSYRVTCASAEGWGGGTPWSTALLFILIFSQLAGLRTRRDV